jgi:hypothetical protein
MGNTPSTTILKKATFQDVADRKTLLISVLSEDDQSVLIAGTCPFSEEVGAVEKAISEKRAVTVYGKNTHDDRIYTKYRQIEELGGDPRVYIGGLFEWMLLQDIYGFDKFPTTRRELDLYKFRPV